MGNGPAPFSDIGKRAKDLLTKDYNYDHKFVLSVPGSTPMGLTATGLKKGQIFLGDISAQYKSGRTIVDVKVDTYSNVSTKVTVHEVMPCMKAVLSFDVPDHKSGKLDIQYLHPRVAIDSSIGLNPSPILNLAAAVGGKEILLGGEVGFDTASASFTKYTAGISFNKPDLSAALILMDKGQTLKASYVHSVDASNNTQVVAEMTHGLSTLENSFTIGSAHVLDRYNTVRTRFSDNGKVAMVCQREWRPKSLITFSAEYDTKKTEVAPKWGLALALKP
ncbi:mitochondrial outer membrane protein porin 4 [Cynara cardunculus var. scolymus]|uniref:Voltage-dependent anion-selective channel protein n=1 Tax=Cynara cardunculus var. scolymus TaxID=59895 RepID=A0A103Y0B6_CYNCS|nr:mitochondrial outer membrane protein porin 4 [Cynara cardunculus var. scolymus]XP_024982538.1 mitochondrial outer membrane protein porin 4 [Cynara cardunculus var. scolymus]XP_024982539.1 mitochondrial outer membrane protein porin 4 [Cynara cardunculus var. scolymus]KVI00157.1 Eukaryotic porin/Tom40 [Cynara cardunculus var. scolymus]